MYCLKIKLVNKGTCRKHWQKKNDEGAQTEKGKKIGWTLKMNCLLYFAKMLSSPF